MPSLGLTQDVAGADVTSIEELLSDAGSGKPPKNIFATDDKVLRKSIVSSKNDTLDGIPATAPDDFRAWMGELLDAIERSDLTTSSRVMARSHGLPENSVQQLVRSFALVQTYDYDFFDDEPKEVRNRARLIRDIDRALVQARRNARLVQLAALTIYKANLCDESLSTLPGDATNRPELLRSIAAVTGCSEPLLETIKVDPTHRVADLAMLNEMLQEQPALTLWLLRSAVDAHVAQGDQREFKLRLTHEAMEDAFALGAEARGLALYDALDPQARGAMLADKQAAFVGTIDGIRVFFGEKSNSSLATDLAAAMYLAGRTDEAREIINADPLLPLQRRLVQCLFAARTATDAIRAMKACGDDDNPVPTSPDIDSLIVSWALDAQRGDPYPMVEAAFSAGLGSTANATLARVYCDVFPEAVAGRVCDSSRRAVAHQFRPERDEVDEEAEIRSALAALDLPEWDSIGALLESERRAGLAYFDDADAEEAYGERSPIEPIHPAFAQHALPADLISSRPDKRSGGGGPPDWPKSWATLPQGFEPVRWSEGTPSVAISRSGLLDRGGEVGRGGYWVHFSNDGGSTWGQPIYTGLAAQFPYVIETNSKLPLLKDDHLQIEVTYALLDTSSITYPPIGLRTLRKTPNLWLDIPIEVLTRDSNGDGLSDLVAAHLGIDGPADEAPFVVGLDAAKCNTGATDPASTVRRKVLLLLSGIDEAAVLEPVDRAPDASLLTEITRASIGDNWPLFVKGHAAELACMAPVPMPVLVYGDKGEVAMQRRSPDFSLIQLPSLVMNRDKTRGYAIWSSGWTGGTIVFWLEAGEWQFKEISRWIT